MTILYYNEKDEDKLNQLLKVSNPKIVVKRAELYLKNHLGISPKVYISSHKNKKYSIYNPTTDKMVHFGQMGFEDYTYHNDLKRRENYLKRSGKIKGNWKDNPLSSNNLSQILLWNADF